MTMTKRYSPEVRERAVNLVLETQHELQIVGSQLVQTPDRPAITRPDGISKAGNG